MLDASGCIRARFIDVARIQKAVANSGFDAIIAMSAENVPLLSGFYNHDIRMVFERFHFVLWPRQGDPAFIVVEKRKNTLLPGDTFIEDIRPYAGEGLDSMRALAEALTDRGIGSGASLGVEGRTFPVGHATELRRLIPGIAFSDAWDFIEGIRTIKLPGEIDAIRTIAQIASDAQDAAFRSARIGETEREMSGRMQNELIRRGADVVAETVFGSGRRTGLWHTMPSDQVIEDGMLVRSDLAGIKDGYFSDIGRSVVMGHSSPQQRDMHSRLTHIKHEIVNFIRPGMLGSDVAAFGRKAYEDAGLEFKWSILGHSIGLAVHESPQLYLWEQKPILPSMTMMVEVGYTDPPNDSFMVEDLIVVGERSASYANDVSAHESLWEVGL